MPKTRAERLMENTDGLDAVIIVNGDEPFLDSTFWYLTEQTSGCFEHSYAIVRSDGTLDVITNILEAETARTAKGNVIVPETKDQFKECMENALKGCRRIGFNYSCASYGTVTALEKFMPDGYELCNASDAIAKTVSVKDDKEIEATRKACRISSQVAAEIPDYLCEGVTEKQVAARMDNRMRELGGTGNAFDTIAAFGVNSSQPHYMPGDHKLSRGEAALFDFGTKYDRYCSDMTRTVFLGRPDPRLERAYEVVREAQLAGIAEYHDGAEAKAADLAARKIIDGSEFKGMFIHSFGHGIGQEVHQGIHISPRSEQILAEGNIVSAEPGVYIPGVGGIRIEDTCLITKNGCEILTSFDHSFTVI